MDLERNITFQEGRYPHESIYPLKKSHDLFICTYIHENIIYDYTYSRNWPIFKLIKIYWKKKLHSFGTPDNAA